MKGAKRFSRIALAALMLICSAAYAHFPEGVTYRIFQFPDPLTPICDGDLGDWDIVPEVYRITTEMLYDSFGGEPNPFDFTVLLMVGWSEVGNKLYVAAETYDNVHMITRSAGSDPQLMWRQDDFEVMVDADHSGGQYAGFADLSEEESKREIGRQAQHYVFAYPNSDGINAVSFMAATWDVEEPWMRCGFQFEGADLMPGITRYEIALTPWDDCHWMGPELSVEHTLTEGDIIGLEFLFADFDDPDDPYCYDAFWTVSGQEETFKRADRFADFLLSPVEESFASMSDLDLSNGIVNLQGETTAFSVDVTNQGRDLSGESEVVVYERDEYALFDEVCKNKHAARTVAEDIEPIARLTLPPIAPGEIHRINQILPISASQYKGIVVAVDVQDKIEESSKANNVLEVTDAQTTAVTEEHRASLPEQWSLAQNTPNPFNASTEITYGLPERSHVRLTVYTLLGQEVARLIEGEQSAGYYTVVWDASRRSSGIYSYRLEAGTYTETRRMLLLR